MLAYYGDVQVVMRDSDLAVALAILSLVVSGCILAAFVLQVCWTWRLKLLADFAPAPDPKNPASMRRIKDGLVRSNKYTRRLCIQQAGWLGSAAEEFIPDLQRIAESDLWRINQMEARRSLKQITGCFENQPD